MFEHIDDPDGHPDPEAARPLIYAAARRRVRRRRFAAGAGVALVLAAGLVSANALADDSGSAQRVTAINCPTIPTSVPATRTGSETSTTSTTSITSTAVTNRTAHATTTPAAGVPSVAPTTGANGIAVTTTTTGVSVQGPPTATRTRACTADDLHVLPTTDKGTYVTAETVPITVSVTNTSESRCYFPFGDAHHRATATQVNTNGSPVPNGGAWSEPHISLGDMTDAQVLAPGETTVYARIQWDQHACDQECVNSPPHQTGAQVALGRYKIIGIVRLLDSEFEATESPMFITISA